MNTLTATNESEFSTLLYGSVRESRVPGERNGNSSPVDKVDDERVVCDRDDLS